MFGNGLKGILRTRGSEATCWGKYGAKQELITPDQEQQDTFHFDASALPSNSLKLALALEKSSLSNGLRNRITTSTAKARRACVRKHSRINLFAPLRCVAAESTRLVTEMPSRACPAEFRSQ
jgi:hypothetical protein